MVSGSLSLPLQGFFSPFPHGTFSLSVAAEYLALDRGRPGFRQGSTCPAVLRYRIMKSGTFRLRGSHALRQAFPDLSAMFRFSLKLHGSSPCGPTTPLKAVWAPPVSLAATPGISGGSLLFLISFPELLRWFTSLSMALPDYFIHPRSSGITPAGLPHSAVRASFGYVLLNPAFRSLSRPSSPCSSMASAINLFSLDHIIVSSSALRRRLCQAQNRVALCPSGTASSFAAEDSLILYCILPLLCIRSQADPHILYGSVILLGLKRVELLTPSLSEKCSNQLSYSPLNL